MSTFRVSGDGQALFMPSESEMQRLCVPKKDRYCTFFLLFIRIFFNLKYNFLFVENILRTYILMNLRVCILYMEYFVHLCVYVYVVYVYFSVYVCMNSA